MKSRLRFAIVMLLVHGGIVACAPQPREGVHAGTAFEAAAAAGMTAKELADSKKEDVVMGWKLEVVGDRARFLGCTAEDACGSQLVDVPASAVVSVKAVGRVRPTREDGSLADETDVLRITVARGSGTSRGGVASDPNRGLVVGGPATAK